MGDMKRIRMTVAYIGGAYEGWQTQKKGTSVQEQIETVLERIAGKHIPVTASGRTDAGVNAAAQVFMFDTDLDMSAYKWKGALNGYLPKDIHITDTEETDERFHARYNVLRKTYVYRIHTGEYDVFTKDTAWQCPYELDVSRMQEAARYMTGTHDFTALNKNTLQEKPDQVRTVERITVSRDGSLIELAFAGKGFLRYQVRMMSALLIEAGKGAVQPEDVRTVLESRSKRISAKNAVPQGLTLQKVEYFEMFAINETGMIREFIPGDALPSGTSLVQLQEDVKEKRYPRTYAVTGRHDQRAAAYMTLTKEDTVCARFDILDPKRAEEILDSLSEDIRKYLCELDPSARILPWKNTEKVLETHEKND